MQPGANIVGGVRLTLALISRDQHTTGDHARNTRQADPFPHAAHGVIMDERSDGECLSCPDDW